ncbi:MAG TPA: hypothetical protein VIY49_09845 [Bryobacteraceae bacterium]
MSDANVEANISLDTPDPGGIWRILLSSFLRDGYVTDNGVLRGVHLTTGPGGILVLHNVPERRGQAEFS